MKLIDAQAKAEKRAQEATAAEPDIPEGAMVSLKAHIAAEVRKAGVNGIELRTIMNARRNNKSGPRFWQCFTDQMWAQAASELQTEWDKAEADAEATKGK